MLSRLEGTSNLEHRARIERILIGLIAIYAIVLQALVAAALPVSSFDSSGLVMCAPGKTTQNGPSDKKHHEHAACCILACAASNFTFVADAFFAIAPVERPVADVVFPKTILRRASSPLRFYFAARGPPIL